MSPEEQAKRINNMSPERRKEIIDMLNSVMPENTDFEKNQEIINRLVDGVENEIEKKKRKFEKPINEGTIYEKGTPQPEFPSRKELTFSKVSVVSPSDVNYDYLMEQARNIQLDEVDFEQAEYDSVDTKIEKHKVYFWIRVYLKEEAEVEPGDDIIIKYSVSGETLVTKFICYSKKGGNMVDYVNGEPVVTSYNTEDDTKVLCLMVDEEKINYDSDDIPFIRKLFRIGRHYEYELLKRTDLTLTIDRTGDALDYYDIEF